MLWRAPSLFTRRRPYPCIPGRLNSYLIPGYDPVIPGPGSALRTPTNELQVSTAVPDGRDRLAARPAAVRAKQTGPRWIAVRDSVEFVAIVGRFAKFTYRSICGERQVLSGRTCILSSLNLPGEC